MHIDARELENNTIIEGDICIVGAGAAGISIALEWIDTSYKIILLEGGGFGYEDKIQDLYKGTTTGQKYFPLKSTRLHYFGGTTGHWGGYCTEFDAIDFKKRDWVPHSGWPISKNDLDPFYKRSKDILDLHATDYSLEYWQKQDSSRVHLPIDKNVVYSKMWQFSAPTRFGNKYRDAIVNAPNIHLYTYANVTNMIANEQLSEITEVTIKNLEGKEHKVKATHYILACGAIQNPRLLLASNKQYKKGLGNENDIVGRYFMDHIEMKSSELWLSNSHPMQLYIYNHGKTKARAELALTEATQTKYKILNGTASLTHLDKARQIQSTIDTWDDEDPRRNVMTTWEKIKKRLLTYKESTIDNIDKAYELFTRIEQAPNPDSRLTIGTKKDALGVPLVNLNWQITSIEKESIRKIHEIIGQQVGISDIGRVKLLEYLHDKNDTSWPSFTSGGWHHIGTTRMSDTPKNGVVDANCKVHGIANLFIAGASCFTTSGAANPTLTIVALSLRLSDHLKERMKNNTSI